MSNIAFNIYLKNTITCTIILYSMVSWYPYMHIKIGTGIVNW